MNHKISAAISEIVEGSGGSLSVDDVVGKLEGMFSREELLEYVKNLGFSDLRGGIKAILEDSGYHT